MSSRAVGPLRTLRVAADRPRRPRSPTGRGLPPSASAPYRSAAPPVLRRSDVIPRHRLRPALLALALLALLAAAAAPSAGAASPDDRLALQPDDVPSMPRAAASAARGAQCAARGAAEGACQRAGRPLAVEATAFRQGAGTRAIRLSVQAFALRDAATARSALGAWRDAQRKAKRKPAALALGTPAFATARRAKGVSDVSIAFRSGAGARDRALPDARRARRRARARPASCATLELARLRTALGRTVASTASPTASAPTGRSRRRRSASSTALALRRRAGREAAEGPASARRRSTAPRCWRRSARVAELQPAQKRALERALDRRGTPRTSRRPPPADARGCRPRTPARRAPRRAG